MIPYEVTQGYSLTLDQLSVAALADLRALLASLDGESPDRQRSVLFEAFPEVFNPYAAATSAVSASFYEEVRALAGVKGAAAQTLDAVEAPRWGSLVGWGSQGSMFERGGQALVYSLLSGGLTQILTEMAADTIIGNAANERVQVGYQRVPAPGCCAFCAMVASRGGLFESENEAERVIGRGVHVSKNFNTDGSRRRGGQSKGVRPRGSRAIGEKYHDDCKCKGVPVFEDNYVEMQDGADEYYNSYRDAADKVNEGLVLKTETFRSSDGSVKNKYTWVHSEAGPTTPKQRTKMILAGMRQDLGVP